MATDFKDYKNNTSGIKAGPIYVYYSYAKPFTSQSFYVHEYTNFYDPASLEDDFNTRRKTGSTKIDWDKHLERIRCCAV